MADAGKLASAHKMKAASGGDLHEGKGYKMAKAFAYQMSSR